MTANAVAVTETERVFAFEPRSVSQGAFKDWALRLAELRASYIRLDEKTKAAIDPQLERSGCLAFLKS